MYKFVLDLMYITMHINSKTFGSEAVCDVLCAYAWFQLLHIVIYYVCITTHRRRN